MKRQIIFDVNNQTQVIKRIPQLIANNWVWKNQNLSSDVNTLYQTRSFPRSRVMRGPQPDLRIITVFRQFMQNNDNSTLVTYEGIFLLDLLPKMILVKLLEQKKYLQNDSDKISDVVVHPSGRELLIFRRKSIQRCLLILSKQDNKYTIEHGQSILLAQKKIFSNVQYHPSGEYVIGLSSAIVDKQTKNNQLFKLYHRNLKLQNNNQFYSECCQQARFPLQFQPWNLAIDKDTGNTAMSVFKPIVCIIDTETLQFKKLQKEGQKLYIIPTVLQNSTINSTIDDQAKFKSVNYVRMNERGYFLIHAYRAKMDGEYGLLTWRYDIQKKEFVDKILLSVDFVSGNTQHKGQRAKCTEIPNINSLACITSNNNTITVSQWDHQKNLTYTLLKKSLGVSRNEEDDFLLEDIFYDQRTGQVCYFFNGTVTCQKIRVKCQQNSTKFNNPRDCSQICFDNKKDWNSLSLKCQACQNDRCSCGPGQKYNFNINRCILSCKSKPRAIEDSQYNNFTKCLCEPPYSWFDDLKMCRFNCSTIQNVDTNPDIDYSKIAQSLCKCRQNYKFIQKIGSLDMQFGMCSLQNCPNNTREIKIGTTSTCECDRSKGYRPKDNGIQQDCIYQVKSGLPVWSIVLIVLLALGIIGALGFFLWRKFKKNRKGEQYTNYKEPGSPAFSNISNKQSEKVLNDKIESERGLEMKQMQKQNICKFCNDEQQRINCKGPCNHHFHFNCIIKSDQAKGLKLKCKECQAQFQIKDLIIIHKNQGFTISD